MKLFLPGLLFILLALSGIVSAQDGWQKTLAPDFDLTSLAGKNFKLSELKGKYVVLNFWFIHCAPCVKEIPQLNKLVSTYGKGNFVFLALTMDNKYDLDSFLKKKPFTYIIIPKSLPLIMQFHDPKDPNVSFPTHIIINPKGEIEFRATGSSGLVPLQKELKKLAALKEPTAAN
jgi:peroxiredoxin